MLPSSRLPIIPISVLHYPQFSILRRFIPLPRPRSKTYLPLPELPPSQPMQDPISNLNAKLNSSNTPPRFMEMWDGLEEEGAASPQTEIAMDTSDKLTKNIDRTPNR